MALILGNLQANAKRLAFVDRKLLSDASLSQKVSVGVNDKVVINGNKATEESESKTSTDAENNDDDTNQSHGKFYHGSGPSTDRCHHYYPNDGPAVP